MELMSERSDCGMGRVSCEDEIAKGYGQIEIKGEVDFGSDFECSTLGWGFDDGSFIHLWFVLISSGTTIFDELTFASWFDAHGLEE